jgi:NAD/NADP transhydrogenase beta subunit
MNLPEKLNSLFRTPIVTRKRIVLALAVAVAADALQVLLLPVAWTFAQSAVDVVAMILIMWLLGFHLLLLPTFIVEFVPVIDMLPTWTACTAAVIAFRKREQRPPAPPTSPPTIEI